MMKIMYFINIGKTEQIIGVLCNIYGLSRDIITKIVIGPQLWCTLGQVRRRGIVVNPVIIMKIVCRSRRTANGITKIVVIIIARYL